MMIKLIKISKTYNDNPALVNIDLDIPQSQTTVLIGPSGCGKSTLIRIIIGLVKQDKGKVEINNEVVSPENLSAIRHSCGYVIQDGGLFPHLTARQNVELPARYLKWERDKTTRRIRELAKLTKFPLPGLDRYPVQLSGGQKQRISLMRGLMLNPDILLLDEPLGALDPLIRYDLQADLKNIFDNLNKTVVLVTHNIGEAAFFGDQIVLIRQGRIVQQGTIQDFMQKPATDFVSRFIEAQRIL